MIQNRLVTLIIIAGGIISVLLSIGYASPFFAVIAAIFFFLSILIWKYGYLIIPIITKYSRIVEIRGDYEVPPTRDYILKKAENGYYVTKFLEIKFYESALDKDSKGVVGMYEAFEKALLSLRNILKISMLISAVDLTKQIDEIKTKRSIAESKKSKIASRKSDDVAGLDREISMWNRYLDKFSKGERPLEILSYASTTAYGLTKDEAVAKVKRQAKEVQTVLSSTLGADVMDLRDLDMLRCFEWDMFLPASDEELKDGIF